ncbi:MAG: SDR family NAD(P)-dependent oxidoreductase, partial [Sphingobacteriales bacterium]
MKILITGATGKLGGLVLDSLFTKTAKENIAVMLRNDQRAEAFSNRGIEARIGNYDDTGSMVKAFKDIDKLYFISGPDLEGRLTQHKNVVAAAIEANVGHIIYTSFSRKGGTEAHPLLTLAEGHIIAENAIRDSGIPYTLLLNNYYMEVIP